MKTPTSAQLLLGIQKDLKAIIEDPQVKLVDPFDPEFYCENEFKSKRNVDSAWKKLYRYYELSENWHVKGHLNEFPTIPSYVLDVARNSGTGAVTADLLKEAGGYLESQWLVFVPFTNTNGMWDAAPGQVRSPEKIGNETWIAKIGDEREHYSWAHKKFKGLMAQRSRGKWRPQISTFHHHLCQIGGGEYAPKKEIALGHYFIFRVNGPLQGLASNLDPSNLFFLFCRGITAVETEGKATTNISFVRGLERDPNGIIAINLKNFHSSRARRNVQVSLKVNLNKDLVKSLRAEKFDSITRQILFCDKLDKRWASIRKSADLLYQFIESESSRGSLPTKNAVSTVILCSAAEALLDLGQGSIKRNLSTLIAANLAPKGGVQYQKFKDLLKCAYEARSAFVHEGRFDAPLDNALLFTAIFSTWLELAQHYSSNAAAIAGLPAFLKTKLKNNSEIYKEAFFDDYL